MEYEHYEHVNNKKGGFETNLAERSLGLQRSASHLVQSLLHGLTVHALVTRASKHMHHGVLHIGRNLFFHFLEMGAGKNNELRVHTWRTYNEKNLIPC